MTNTSNTDAIGGRGFFARVFANLGWLLTGKAAGAVMSTVYLALATRTLRPAGFGEFALVLGTAQAVVALVSFESWQIVIRYGLPGMMAGRRADLGRLVSFCLGIDLAAALVGCVVATFGILALGVRVGLSPSLLWPAIGFCAVMLLSVRSTAVGVLRLHDRFGLGALADAVTPAARLVGAAAAVLAGASVRGFLVAWAVAEVATAAAYWTIVATRTPVAIRPGWLFGPGIARRHPDLARFAWATNAGTSLGAVGRQGTVLIVGALTGPAGAGAFRLASQLSQALARVADMFARAMFAELSRVHHGGARDGAGVLLRRTTRAAFGAGVVMAALLATAGGPFLTLVAGRAYAGAYPLLLLLGAASIVDVVGVGFQPTLAATGRAGVAFVIRLGATAAMLVLLFALSSTGDPVGAGIAVLASSVIGFVAFAAVSRPLSAGRAGPVARPVGSERDAGAETERPGPQRGRLPPRGDREGVA